MTKLVFPQDFFWGAATSAPQTEGDNYTDGKGQNLWDFWSEQNPERFFNGIGSKDTSTFYKNYKKDIALMKEVGLNSFRTSISWSRLIPDGDGEVNQKAVEFYNNVINELRANNIKVFMNLYHFDMPMALQNIGGWENKDVVKAFARYARICFELFGDRVDYWFSQNEPIVPVEAGYLYQFHYPEVVDFKRAIQVGYNEILAHCMFVQEYRKLNFSGKVGIILNLTPSYSRSNLEADLTASYKADLIYNRSFLDPVTLGEFPKDLITLFKEHDLLPICTSDELALIKNNTIDILGVNYYQPRRIKAKESPMPKKLMPESFADYYDMPVKRMNPYRGWEIYPQAMYDIAINIRDNYNNIPWFISESGMGVEGEERYINSDGIVEDDYRIEFITEHLKYLHQGISEGSNCLGFHLWTYIDCWSWTNAYKNRYGLISLDLETQARTVKKSGRWYKKLSESNTLEVE